jgi:hypothetical protein
MIAGITQLLALPIKTHTNKGVVPRWRGLAAVIGTIQTDSGTIGSDRHLNSASRGRALIRSCTLPHLLVNSGGSTERRVCS